MLVTFHVFEHIWCCETNILPTLEKYGASTLEYLSNNSVCSQLLNILAQLITPFVIFLRKVHFVVILTVYVMF